ncbi:3'(2'),5'-bisphosphate nucleotidase CysQ family protein [Haloplasma contractile]|uniref:3'5'-bisphosphate nucleotidase CysQ protein n=1 Tax=Haloplasma contractile SSD-17B TaxID=1033810 RepID=F7PT05_9MOLU|nr:3'(2'),5'-bisphosphate nucleotidase CysQ [Haloplasma contractile]ERJ12583.1 3'5'-bisphosphate nucleotidase CysQ protein [Haloplasma contractile SSD-17B]
MKYEQELYVAKQAAILAGTEIMKIYNTEFDVEMKEDESPVTNADIAANEIILSKLKEKFPNYAYLSEESVDDVSRIDEDLCFIIDPIDGTKEFVNRNGEFTVNIALAYKGEVVVGVIYAPVLEELYYASKENGAYKVKEREITQLKVSDRDKDLRIAKSRSHGSELVEQLLNENRNKISKEFTVGSSLKGCFLAAGIVDSFYRFGMGTKEWDVAAMSIIVLEAGGVFKDLNGDSFKYNKEDVYNRNGYYILNKEENLFDYKHLLNN